MPGCFINRAFFGPRILTCIESVNSNRDKRSLKAWMDAKAKPEDKGVHHIEAARVELACAKDNRLCR